jgi:hypothetical protein
LPILATTATICRVPTTAMTRVSAAVESRFDAVRRAR